MPKLVDIYLSYYYIFNWSIEYDVVIQHNIPIEPITGQCLQTRVYKL